MTLDTAAGASGLGARGASSAARTVSREGAHRVLVVGGGFGGLRLARSLEGERGVHVTLVDRENHHLFQPLLYQVATAGLAPASIATPIRSMFDDDRNVEVILGEAWSVDHAERELVLRDGERLPYDVLVIAAGAKTNYFGQHEWARHAHGLKDVRDAIRIRERVLLAFEAAERERNLDRRARLLTFVVIGGGPTGVEMAGAISELARSVLAGDFKHITPSDIRVVLVEMADRLLLPFAEDLSFEAAHMLSELGVEVQLGTRVTGVDEGVVELGQQGSIHASVVVWASGVKPVSLADRLDVTLDKQGRICVDEHCAVLGRPEMFAIGDIARFVPNGADAPLPGLAPVALQQGKHVAAQIVRDKRRLPREPFVYVDKGQMATIGRARAVAETGRLQLAGLTAWFAWLFIHVLYLVGFRNRVTVLFDWFWQYATFGRGSRLITARHDPADMRPSPLLAVLPTAEAPTADEPTANAMPGHTPGR